MVDTPTMRGAGAGQRFRHDGVHPKIEGGGRRR
jgi:hypothetical protein